MIPAVLSVIGGLTIPVFDVELPPYADALQLDGADRGVWMLIGIVLYFVLRSRNPEALERMGEIYGGEAPSPTDDLV